MFGLIWFMVCLSVGGTMVLSFWATGLLSLLTGGFGVLLIAPAGAWFEWQFDRFFYYGFDLYIMGVHNVK